MATEGIKKTLNVGRRYEPISICTHRFSLAIHDGLKFFKVAKFNFQFLHLGLDKQCHEALDLPLFNLSQVLSRQKGGTKETF